MSPPAQLHTPVLLHTCVELLAPALERPGAVVVDATLGMGGHSEALLERFGELRLIGLDRDPSAIRLATQRLAPYAERIDLVQAVYDELPEVLRELSVREVNGVLFDLGVSSLQLDSDARGFSYARDTELDMRMNPDDPQTAADVLNTYSVAELTRVLRDFGEERFARRIAQRVVAERASEPFSTSGRLVELIRQCVPAATRRTGGNPAKRTFQALRIEVNRELDVLRRAIPSAIEALAVGGRIAVMSYHSGEDRIVKQALRDVSTSTAPPDLPIVPEEYQPVLRLLTRGAQTADPAEVAVNPRAASVRLRAGERVRPAARGGQRSGKAQRSVEAQRSGEAQGSGKETA